MPTRLLRIVAFPFRRLRSPSPDVTGSGPSPRNVAVPCAVMLALLWCAALPGNARGDETTDVDALVHRAVNTRLHEERMWEILLHYKTTLWGNHRSRIDDPRFFLSPTGSTDPESELEATVRSFFVPSPADGTHTACRFPARFQWLTAALGIEPSALPPFQCTERDRALAAVNGRSAVLVFPVGHINSPASMFGHTLIRVDGSAKSSLVSFAANYAATATDTNGFVYAWKGLFGMYKGYYSLLPYYLKVKEYSDLEHRDMWEYTLRLNSDEVRRMIDHLWELQNIHSSYYFLDENCSFNLLYLLEAARPELRLTERTGILVLPTDTIRIAINSGIVEKAHYRPSRGARIGKMLSLLDEELQKVSHDLAMGISQPDALASRGVSPVQKITALDLAAEYAQLRYARKELTKEEFSRLYLALLGQRSMLGQAPDGLYETDEPPRPETGHGTTRAALGGGIRRSRAFMELAVQPQFHTLLDPDQGYLKGAQIKFFDTSIRYYPDTTDVRLQKLRIVDILSIAPRNMFFHPVSWRVQTGFEREPMRDGNDRLIYRLDTGGGYSYSSPFNGIWYGLGEIDVNAGSSIRGGVTVGPGFTVGALEQPAERWKLHLFFRGFVYKVGDDRWLAEAGLAQNVRVTRNNSIGIDCSYQFVNDHHIFETGALWNYYF